MPVLDWLKQRLLKDEPRCAESVSGTHSDDLDDDAEVDPDNPFPEPVAIEITDIIDLHTIPPRDVKRVVEAYLEEAHHKGFRSVRLIHGKGRGVQRETVRKVLARTPYVSDWTDAPPAAGGIGATIAHLSRDERSSRSHS